jgi:O-antigen/teichoic acid export membrane protein
LLALLSGPIASALAIPRGWVWAIILVAAGRYVTSVVLNLWQVRQKPLAYAAYSFSLATIALGVAVLLIVGMGFGWEGRVIGELVSTLLLSAVGFFVLAKGGWLRHGFDRAYMGNALRYGTGLVPHLYGGVLITTTDRLFLTHMVGVEETGVYVVAVQIAMMIGILHHSFNQAWAPWLFGVLKRNVPAELDAVRRFTRFYNVAIIALALGLAAVTPWLLGFLVGPEFRGAAQFVIWLALASAFEGMYKIVVNQIFWANKTHWLAWITLATAVANVLFNYLLISAFGAVGAAQATALTMFISYLLTARLSAQVSRTLAAAGQSN